MPLVSLHHGRPVTTSLVVAERFRKNHKDVLRAVANLECSKEFTQRNFAPSTYIDPTGRSLPQYELTRDGFAFLAMGFTGPEAARWKEAFIDAFSVFEQAIAADPLFARVAAARLRAAHAPPAVTAYVLGTLAGLHALLPGFLDQIETALDTGVPPDAQRLPMRPGQRRLSH